MAPPEYFFPFPKIISVISIFENAKIFPPKESFPLKSSAILTKTKKIISPNIFV
jgi:hypothetical protein